MSSGERPSPKLVFWLLALTCAAVVSCGLKRVELPSFEGISLAAALSELNRTTSIEAVLSVEYEKRDGLMNGDAFLRLSDTTLALRLYYLGFLAGEVMEEEGVIRTTPNLDRDRTVLLVDGLRTYLFYQFPVIGFTLIVIGIFALFKIDRVVALFLLLLICINAFFFISFAPGVERTTKYTFYISDYALFSILIGYGFFTFMNYVKNKGYSLTKIFSIGLALIIFLPLLLYNVTPYATKALGVDLLHARTIPYRNNETYFLNPKKRGYIGAARYAEEAFKTATLDSIIIADFTYDEQTHEAVAVLETAGGKLELIQPLDENNQPQPFEPTIRRKGFCPHLALQTDDIEQTLIYLKERGVALIRGPEEMPDVAKWFFVCDPDQNVIEFFQDFQSGSGAL